MLIIMQKRASGDSIYFTRQPIILSCWNKFSRTTFLLEMTAF